MIYLYMYHCINILTMFARYAISGDLMKSLGWKPRLSLQQRIAEFSAWMKENPEWSTTV